MEKFKSNFFLFRLPKKKLVRHSLYEVFQFQHIPKQLNNGRRAVKCLLCHQLFYDMRKDFLRLHRKSECSGNQLNIASTSTNIGIDSEDLLNEVYEDEQQIIDSDSDQIEDEEKLVEVKQEEIVLGDIHDADDNLDRLKIEEIDDEQFPNTLQNQAPSTSFSVNSTISIHFQKGSITSTQSPNQVGFRNVKFADKLGSIKTIPECNDCGVAFSNFDTTAHKKHRCVVHFINLTLFYKNKIFKHIFLQVSMLGYCC